MFHLRLLSRYKKFVSIYLGTTAVTKGCISDLNRQLVRLFLILECIWCGFAPKNNRSTQSLGQPKRLLADLGTFPPNPIVYWQQSDSRLRSEIGSS